MIHPQSEIALESNHRYSETAADQSCQTSHGIEGIDTTGSTIHHNHQETTTNDEPIVELRQKLMVADEVYLYKIPPLQTSGGHRAEHWNLASPIATCSLLVERRGDCLVLEFRQKPEDTHQQQPPPATFGRNTSSNIFAQAVIDCSLPLATSSGTAGEPPTMLLQQQRKIQHWIEGTIDSSRYFTLRISSGGGREALIGFGFRDRDQAIDLRESLQHYEASMRREYEASTMNNSDNTASTISKYTIPKLADGERIHVRTGKSSDGNKATKSKSKGTDSPTKSDRPILLKKPPPPNINISTTEIASHLSYDLNNRCDVTTTAAAATTPSQSDDVNHNLVVLQPEATDNDDDDDDWDTEFVSAS